MLDFVFILCAILEITATIFIVVKISKFEKQINIINENLVLVHGIILEVLKQLRNIISKINKVVRIFQNKKFILAANIIKTTLTIIQVIILIQSIRNSQNLLKNLKGINFKVIKKLLMANAIYKLVKYLMKVLTRTV